ncbi:Putative zinc transporter msc2 [Sporothrix curviconia]|uniref:Zinc transporter n=1 Tax=Sporothrix curviconia TaxID=1260050 RepID=A0ABP0BL77_9PEZI
MASSYVMPGASISPPKSHLSSFMDNAHSHSHGHLHGHAHGHSHAHSHGHSHAHSHSSQTHSPSPLALGRSPPAASVSHLGGSYARSHRRVNNSSAISLRGGSGPNFSFDQSQMHTPSQSHDHDHNHNHSDSHSHDHNHDHDHEHPPNHASEQSLGGAGPYTPSRAAFDKSSYAAPKASSVVFDKVEAGSLSRFTQFAMQYTAQYPLIHAVMKERDSRRIFYFMTLNFAFMSIQAFYGYVTDSLGLLSDSIHMFFDCVALAVGLLAAVASKWPPSERFPYGFGKIETLSGFANGIFLILISVEIMVEAVERLMGGRETQRLWELFVVSTLGLLVNLVGMFSFGHHHHHGHGHSHGHDEHSHDFSSLSKKNDCSAHAHAGHDHGHSHDHGHDHTHDHSHDHSHGVSHNHGHSHSHDNENMYGIYLHVLADTLGSAAVIVSTVLTHFWNWSGWDPLASFLIAVLILGSAVPLVTSSARRLLLTIPDAVEYSLRETLAGVPGLLGVASYSAPKFWIDDRAGTEDKMLGVMHVVAARGADMEDVRDRVREYMLEKGIDVVVQVERDGDANCWCGLNRASIAGGHAPKPSINF